MSDPSTHRSTGRPVAKADEAWKPWSQAWTKHITTLTGRTDLHVLVGKGGLILWGCACTALPARRVPIINAIGIQFVLSIFISPKPFAGGPSAKRHHVVEMALSLPPHLPITYHKDRRER